LLPAPSKGKALFLPLGVKKGKGKKEGRGKKAGKKWMQDYWGKSQLLFLLKVAFIVEFCFKSFSDNMKSLKSFCSELLF